ncbi:MAG: HNH endonuclease [Chloroflexi bacterium]|nr:HNH endonuclease [Chloroflexota bacterium]
MEIQESLRRWLEDRKRRLVPNTEDFRSALHSKLQEAVKQGITYLDINSGEFHREPGGSSGRNNRLPVCCNVMWQEMREGDEVLERPPKGKGASLTIRYQLPRK